MVTYWQEPTFMETYWQEPTFMVTYWKEPNVYATVLARTTIHGDVLANTNVHGMGTCWQEPTFMVTYISKNTNVHGDVYWQEHQRSWWRIGKNQRSWYGDVLARTNVHGNAHWQQTRTAVAGRLYVYKHPCHLDKPTTKGLGVRAVHRAIIWVGFYQDGIFRIDHDLRLHLLRLKNTVEIRTTSEGHRQFWLLQSVGTTYRLQHRTAVSSDKYHILCMGKYCFPVKSKLYIPARYLI